MIQTGKLRRTFFVIQGILQAFIGLGAVISGGMLALAPDGRLMGMSLDFLKGSPFRSFLIPGLILCALIGLDHLTAAILSFRNHRWAGYAGGFCGLGLLIWLFTQVSMIGGGHWLQNLYFGLGILEIAIAFLQTGLIPES